MDFPQRFKVVIPGFDETVAHEYPQPCGCIIQFNAASQFVGGKCCAKHQAERDAAMDRFVAEMDAKAAERIYGSMVPRESRHMFRPQRSTLADAMAEAKEFDGTWEGLQALQYRGDVLVAVEEYGGIDDRIGWDTYIVTVTNPAYGDASTRVAGFTNGAVPRGTLRNDTPQ